MKYGCIAERLGHSFSREIHNMIGDYEYELCEVPKGELDAFMKKRDFLGINVTIPYKRDVMPYLDVTDGEAKKIGAVNTVVNRDGKLFGYNTDYAGMRALILRSGIGFSGKKVLVLGTGGTSHMASELARQLGAGSVFCVSRTGRDGALTYDEAYMCHADADVIINATPAGMYPNVSSSPVDIAKFPMLSGVIDAVYNPIRTELVLSARERGIKAVGGLYMLVSQAVFASEHFFGKKSEPGTAERIYEKLLAEKENIVLTGMPGAGKSSIGRRIAARTGRTLIDTDAEIVSRIGMSIAEYFEKYGEAEFRERESEVIEEVSKNSGCIISTGGGAILRPENVRALKRGGRIYYIMRPTEYLTPTASRPLASDSEAIKKRFEERRHIYEATADVIYRAVDGREHNAKMIERLHYKR